MERYRSSLMALAAVAALAILYVSRGVVWAGLLLGLPPFITAVKGAWRESLYAIAGMSVVAVVFSLMGIPVVLALAISGGLWVASLVLAWAVLQQEEARRRQHALGLRLDALERLRSAMVEIASTLDAQKILATLLQEVVEFSGADFGAAITPDENGKWSMVASIGGSEEQEQAYQHLLNEGKVADCLQRVRRSPRMVTARASECIERGILRVEGHLLAVPIAYGGQLTAALLLQGPAPFSSVVEDFVDWLARLSAIALANARTYEEHVQRNLLMHRRTEQMRLLLEVTRSLRSDRPLEETLLEMAYAIQEAIGFDRVLVSVVEGNIVRRVAGAGIPLDVLESLRRRTMHWDDVAYLLREEFRYGGCYYIPAEQHSILEEAEVDFFSDDQGGTPRRPGYWHPQDLLLVLLTNTQGKVIGYMTVDKPRDGRMPSRETMEVLEIFAAQIALAIENFRLVNDMRLQLNTLQLFNDLSQSVMAKLDLETVLNTVVQAVTRKLGYDYATIFLQDEEGYFVPMAASSAGYPFDVSKGSAYALGEGLVGQVAESGMPIVVEDVDAEPRYRPPSENFPLKFGSAVLVPLRVEQHTVGVLSAERKEKGAFAPAETAILMALSDQVSVAIENARLFQQVKRFSEEMEARVQERTEALAQALEALRSERDRVDVLYRIASELVFILDLDRVLYKTLDLLREATGADWGTIQVLDQDGRVYDRAIVGREGVTLPPGGRLSSFDRHSGLIGWLLRERQSAIIDDVLQDDRWIAREEEPARSVLAVPILDSMGMARGAIFLLSEREAAFSENDVRMVEAAAIQLGNAINRAELYDRIRQQTQEMGAMLRSQQVEAAKTQAILEGIADGVMVADAEDKVILFNAAAERILGVRRSQAHGRRLDEMLGLYGSQALAWMERIRAWREEPESYQSGDYLAERLTMDEKVVSIHLSPVFSPSKEFLGTVAVFRDITSEVAADRAKTEFVSMVSHELRTPMTSIKGYVDLMLMGGPGPINEMQRHFLEVIRTNADRLTELVNDLLDISRIETGKIVLHQEAIDVRAIMDEVVQTILPKVEEKGLKINVVSPSSLPKAWGDRARVNQIITNLVGNAYKYTPTGGEITLYAYVRNGKLHIAVRDTGIGISKEDQERIFERFYRVDNPIVQAEAGTGLGLAITTSLIQMHGGEIFVESEPGYGSIFTFTLPLAEGEPAEDIGRCPAPFVREVKSHILVVEDDAEIAEMLRLLLSDRGYEVSVAHTGSEALQLAKEMTPDLIALDLMLPDINGLDVLQELKQQPETSDIPVIVVSVLREQEKARQLGAVAYITKPIEEEQLLDVVERTLTQKGLILAVDDDRHILSLLRHSLTHQGYTVRALQHGEQVPMLAKQLHPSLILLDLRMPGMSGYEVMKALKEDEETASIPIVVMTAYGREEQQLTQQVKALGALEIIAKPFSIDALVSELEEWVENVNGSEEHSSHTGHGQGQTLSEG